jgi:hypothetical protein
MKNPCPKKTKIQCLWWEVTGISLLVFFAVYAIVVHVPGYSLTHEILLAAVGTFCILWCLWAVRTFRNIMVWWSNLQTSLDNTSKLLEETKQDLKDIKSIEHEFSSR